MVSWASLFPKLRDYFAEFLNDSYLNALEFSSCLPVSVCGTITLTTSLEAFLVSVGSAKHISSLKLICSSYFRINDHTDLPIRSSYILKLTSMHQLDLPFCVTPSLKRCKVVQEYLTCLSSPTPIGLDLDYWLTLSGWTNLTETLDFRRIGISPIFSLLIPTCSLLWSDICPYGQTCIYQRTLLYLYYKKCNKPRLRWSVWAPFILQRKNTWPVSCYAFFKGWLLLSQPPGCICVFTSFPT